ncbi:hypothetical protein DPMN_139282 [Dreissena polymorpha]|uniref:Uncharacterized protein n=1 Tax=Dreissena polymorpha TaxID=45954 RepID=A0A9D4G897_DREPO|nr:hypothetical protein DPMN_139282 [Dreissena polymorpha]
MAALLIQRRKSPGGSEGSVEEGQEDLGKRCRPLFRGGGPMKIIEVPQNGGTQSAIRAG